VPAHRLCVILTRHHLWLRLECYDCLALLPEQGYATAYRCEGCYSRSRPDNLSKGPGFNIWGSEPVIYAEACHVNCQVSSARC